MKYELRICTAHCIGRFNHVIGFVDTEAEARTWVEGQSKGASRRRALPKNDPVFGCPVKHCHMKHQAPIFSYRKIDA